MVTGLFRCGKRSRKETVEEIKKALADGLTTPEAIADRIGASPENIIKVSSEERISTPFPKTRYHYQSAIPIPARDALVDKGLSGTELGQLWSINPVTARMYIERAGKNSEWKQAREEWSDLYKRLKGQDSHAYQMVLDYLSVDPFTSHTIPALYWLFHKGNELESDGDARFRRLADEFSFDLNEVVKIYGTVREARKSKPEIFRPTKRSRKDIAEEIKRALADGLTTLEELASKVDTTARNVIRICSMEQLDVPFSKSDIHYKKLKKIPARSVLIKKGLSSSELSQLWGVNQGYVNQYTLMSGEHEDWQQRKAKFGKLYKGLRRLDIQAYQMVLDYLSVYPFTSYPIPALHKLFHRASELESQGSARFRKLDDEFYLDSGESAEIYRTAKESREQRAAA